MAKNQLNPEELEMEELEDVLASADLDELDDEEFENDAETGEEDSEGEEQVEDESEEETETEEDEPSEDEIEEILKSLDIETEDKEGQTTEEGEEDKEPELTEEEEDLLSKLLENPEEVIDTLVEKKLEEKLKSIEQQQREMDEKWNKFLEQSEEVSQVFPDFNDTMNEGVLEKLANDPKNAAIVLEAENIAEAAYYYAKFGTPVPSAKQLKELMSSEETPSKEEKEGKEAPVPPKGKAAGVTDDENLVPETLDIADLDF